MRGTVFFLRVHMFPQKLHHFQPANEYVCVERKAQDRIFPLSTQHIRKCGRLRCFHFAIPALLRCLLESHQKYCIYILSGQKTN